MKENIYFYFMHTHILFILSLVLLWFNTTTATSHGHQQLVAAAAHTCIDKERQALLDFKAPLQDPNNMLSTWRPEEEDDCCQWLGVTCNNQTGHVTELVLDGTLYSRSLEGEITNSLLNLTYLSHLDLLFNSFNGTFPKFICSMTHLTFLSLAHNEFTGTIPESIGNMTKLTSLILAGNNFNGIIPKTIGSLTKLSDLYLGWNKFSGTIPMSIGSLTKLTTLNLAANNFSGVIPRCIGSLTKLTSLNLAANNFYGTIPREFGNLTNLEYLGLVSLRSCRVENLDWLSSLSSLEVLFMDRTSLAKANNWVNVITGLQNLHHLSLDGCDLSHVMHPYSSSVNSSSSIDVIFLQENNLNSPMYSWLCPLFGKKFAHLVISGNTFHGNLSHLLNILSTSATTLESLDASNFSSNKLGPHFPKWIQKLKNLIHLDLSNNSISDTVSTEYWNQWKSSQLNYLDLSFNNIIGKLPKSLSNHDLYFIDLSFNCFYGPIPAFPAGLFQNLTNLEVLNVGHNMLSGRIPPSIGYLGHLMTLYLYNNSFSGELPLNLKNCSMLSLLDLGANILNGTIPVWIGKNMSRLYALSLKSNNLFGTIPSQICQLERLQILDLSFNNLHGTIPPCVNSLTSMVQKGLFFKHNEHHYLSTINNTGYSDFVDNSYIDHLLIEWQGKVNEFSSILVFLKVIDLSSNNLTGQIPNEVTNLHGLLVLDLSNNSLVGEIPRNIGHMTELLTLNLSRNMFSGEMPSSMSDMHSLNDLDLSFNNLSGRVPSSTQLQSFPPEWFTGNVGLCGLPTTTKCLEDEDQGVPPISDYGDAESTGELQRWFYIGGATGFATAFWIACSALLLNRRLRHTFFHFHDCLKDWVYVKVVVFIARLQRVARA
ncbi:leucine-rich repeat-containing protein [Tanacetum coccineum]